MSSTLFRQLTRISRCTFSAQSLAGSQMNWHQNATGQINVRPHAPYVDFDETLIFPDRQVRDAKRWCVSENELAFARWRNGDYETIFTFQQQDDATWQLQQPYWCAPDAYHAELHIHDNRLILTMYIHSQRKNECLRYVYE